MKSQPQSPEFRNYAENFHLCSYTSGIASGLEKDVHLNLLHLHNLNLLSLGIFLPNYGNKSSFSTLNGPN